MEEQEVQKKITKHTSHHLFFTLSVIWDTFWHSVSELIVLKQFSNTVFYFLTHGLEHILILVSEHKTTKKSSVCPSKHNSISKVQELIYFVMLYIFKFQLF